jgi:ferrochelatase
MKKRIAVVLFNLGGPDKAESIRPFLFNFFMDKNIIRLPLPLRFMIATLIANKRSKNEAGSSYGFLGGGSPLLENTQAQADALQGVLAQRDDADYSVFVCMRYWHPMAEDVVRKVAAWNPDRIVLLPLYPQYSTTTTRSSLQEWNRFATQAKLDAPTSLVCCYPEARGFVNTSADNVRKAYEEALTVTQGKDLPMPRVLFSAHGLPEDVITDGDPYQAQCEQSARAIARATGIEGLDWTICYQSRVGPKKWIGPSTSDEIKRAALDKTPLVVYPHAFVNEHVETLVEIEIEYRHEADALGVPYFARVPTVSTDGGFIEDLAGLVVSHARQSGIQPAAGVRVCPLSSKRCCMSECSVITGGLQNEYAVA